VVDQSKEDISDCKGLRGVAMATKFWSKYAKKITKMAITSVVSDISMQFGFEIGFVPSGN